MIIDIVKVFLPAVGAFIAGILITPILTNYLYANQMWKKKAGKKTLDGQEAKIFNELHKEKEVNTPRMGGIVIWFSTAFTITLIWAVSHFFPSEVTTKLDFASRNQTWVPFATLIFGALVGLLDDYLEIKGSEKGVGNGGLSLKKRLIIVSLIALACAWWFYTKLDVTGIGLPFGMGELYLGPLFLLLFLLVAIFIYAGVVVLGPRIDENVPRSWA
jgi:phospho-N-acetylmuramoyl-pentapeptide-transferase